MKIKHFAGYGTVNATKVKDNSCTLHVRVAGDHEWGLVREDDYDLFGWLVKRFDRSFKDKSYADFRRLHPMINVTRDYVNGQEVVDYRFVY